MKKILLLFFLIFSNQINAQTQLKKKLNKDFILDSIKQIHQILSKESFIVNMFKEDIELITLDGKKIKLSDFKSKPIAIKFWGTWCKPCHQLAERDKKEGYSDEAIYIYIAERDDKTKLEAFIKKNKDKYFSAKNTYHIFADDNPDLVKDRENKRSFFTAGVYPAYYWITKDGWFIHSAEYMVGFQQDNKIIDILYRLKKFIF